MDLFVYLLWIEGGEGIPLLQLQINTGTFEG
jgi:hypothetical protein